MKQFLTNGGSSTQKPSIFFFGHFYSFALFFSLVFVGKFAEQLSTTYILPTTPYVTVPRVGGVRGWSVLGSVPLMGPGVFISLSSWLAGQAQSLLCIISRNRMLKERHNRARQGSAG